MLGQLTMKPRENTLRPIRFEAEEKARKGVGLENMIREFEGMVLDLDRHIASEEDRTGVKDARHFAYSTFAKAARQRRDNLKTSVDELMIKLEQAVSDRDLAAENLAKLETGEGRETGRSRRRGEAADERAGQLARPIQV